MKTEICSFDSNRSLPPKNKKLSALRIVSKQWDNRIRPIISKRLNSNVSTKVSIVYLTPINYCFYLLSSTSEVQILLLLFHVFRPSNCHNLPCYLFVRPTKRVLGIVRASNNILVYANNESFIPDYDVVVCEIMLSLLNDNPGNLKYSKFIVKALN